MKRLTELKIGGESKGLGPPRFRVKALQGPHESDPDSGFTAVSLGHLLTDTGNKRLGIFLTTPLVPMPALNVISSKKIADYCKNLSSFHLGY